MTREEFLTRLKACNKAINRAGALWFISLLGALALILTPAFTNPIWIALVMVAPLSAMFWFIFRQSRKHGLHCPHCDSSLNSLHLRTVMTTGCCGYCRTRLFAVEAAGESVGATSPMQPRPSQPWPGIFRGLILPACVVVCAFVICCLSLRHLVINGTMFATDPAAPARPEDRDLYYEANREFLNGNLDSATTRTAMILEKVPNHSPANQLMAKIQLARGNRAAAINYLRRALTTSLDREEISKQITQLESAP